MTSDEKKQHLAQIGQKTRWAPGRSPNPGGKPQTKWLTSVFNEVLREKLRDPKFRAEFKESLWKKLLSDRMVSAMTMAEVLNRTEGRVAQQVEVSGDVDLKSILERARARLNEDDEQQGQPKPPVVQ
jgi:hypothetical protein